MTRCILKGTTTFSGQPQTAIYLHNDDNNAEILIQDDQGHSARIKSGQGIQIIDSNSNVTCLDYSKCHISIWHTTYRHDKAMFVSDGAGCALFLNNQIIPTDFSLFFDFGPTARLSPGQFYHKRESGVFLYTISHNENTNQPETTETVITPDPGNQTDKLLYDLNGPGILHVSSSLFTPSNFNLIIGSTIRIPKSFSNHPITDSFFLFDQQDGAKKQIITTNFKVLVAKEQKVWYIISIILCCLTGIIFVPALISLICICKSSHLKKFCL